jgi:hypothetical protein
LRCGIATQGVPSIAEAAHHLVPSREKLAKVTLGRRAVLLPAVCRTESVRPSLSSKRYSTACPSKVTQVVPPVNAAAGTDARLPAGCASPGSDQLRHGANLPHELLRWFGSNREIRGGGRQPAALLSFGVPRIAQAS